MGFFLSGAVVFIASWGLTGLFRRYALHRMLDIPNARSSHTVPTPRGGGLAVGLSYLLAVALTGVWLGGLQLPPVIPAVLGAGATLVVLGYLDDRGHVAARWRLLGQFAASLWVLYCFHGLPPLVLLGWRLDLIWLGYPLTILALVWLANLYNFMDGIDGIAAIETVSVCLGGMLVYGVSGAVAREGFLDTALLLLLAAAAAGFLVWNWPPAKIFMGDAGSGFLGMVLGILGLRAAWVAPPLLWSWLILLGVFVVDATFTLLRRLCRGEKLYQAHRRHAYQVAARSHQSHRTVTLAVAVINVVWLLPVALGVALGKLDGLLGLLIAYAPLLLLAVKYRAGAPEVVAS